MGKSFQTYFAEMANRKLKAIEEENMRLQAEIDRLREALETVKNICTEQDTNIDSLVLAHSVCRRALNGTLGVTNEFVNNKEI